MEDALSSGDDNVVELGKNMYYCLLFLVVQGIWSKCIKILWELLENLVSPIFFTMTYNPKWEEITHALLLRQDANDQLDLVSRVMHEKLNAMMDDIVKKEIILCYLKALSH